MEGFFINKRFMCVFNDNPFALFLFDAFLWLVTDFNRFTLYHISYIGFVLQHIRNTLAGPETTVRAFLPPLPAAIGCRCWNPFFIQHHCNPAAAHAGQSHCKYAANDRCNCFINYNFIFFSRMHLIAIHRFSADELPLLLFIMLYAFNFFGYILCIHVIHNRTKGCNIICGGFYAGINAIQEGDITDSFFWKIPLHIMPRHNIVSPQAW